MHQALDLCREFNGQPGMPRLYASAGIYPHNTPEADDAALAKLDALLAEPEVIACGEIGLDYYHEGAAHPCSAKGLIRQLKLPPRASGRSLSIAAAKEGADDAWDDLFAVLEEHWASTGLGGIMHCFGGGWEQARRSLDLGFLISFAGNLTYPKAQPLRDVAARMPLTAFWSKPTPPGSRRRPIAASATSPPVSPRRPRLWPSCYSVTDEEIAAATTKNFARLFHLPPDVGNW